MSTKIEWTDETWNPLRGCSRVSDGCQNCYAERMAARFCGPGQPYEGLVKRVNRHPVWTGNIKLVPEMLDQPLRWKKPRRIFVNSMSDLFHESVPMGFVVQVFAVMALAHHHTFQVLTKRPERMRDILCSPGFANWVFDSAHKIASELRYRTVLVYEWPRSNIWIGVSCENQATADERIPPLLHTPAAVRWISAEPLLGPIDLRASTYGAGLERPSPRIQVRQLSHPAAALDWVIVGGESGPNARPMHPDWARSLRDQCRAAGVPFFMKQMGGPVKRSMPAIPPDLLVRESPNANP